MRSDQHPYLCGPVIKVRHRQVQERVLPWGHVQSQAALRAPSTKFVVAAVQSRLLKRPLTTNGVRPPMCQNAFDVDEYTRRLLFGA